MGFPTTVSMNLVSLHFVLFFQPAPHFSKGMVVGWGALSPLSKLSGWAPGPAGDMANGARGWILWTSLGIMCADSFISLIPVVADYVNDFISKDHSVVGEDITNIHETETEDRLVPMSWVLTGVTTSVIIGTILVWVVFGHDGIKPWATILGFVLGGMLSIIGCVGSMCPRLLQLTRPSQSPCSRRNRFEPSFWSRQDIAVILRLDTARECRRKYHRRRSGRSGSTTVSWFNK
jgi:hypothetical protein